ncbi:uncharacterized protein LOC131682827 [Topomyia yanbarensis]|uniref:uncharacterized protein LOC131682827 n=1 Tax=Topomyia yanbarensis TaxID=2498891 RepID=UPI00273B16FE|nr:uncharacterized protein LOC131682827 [Topomyia yanbarensis]
MNIIKKCALCQQPAELMCSRCLEVYCSVECQIRDWADHKKVCINIPKLYPNNSYLEILAGGVALPLRSSSVIEQATSRMLAIDGRSLKPLRKPNIPLGTVEASINREVTSKFNNTSNDESHFKSSAHNITVTAPSTDCEKRFSAMKIEVFQEKSNVNHSSSIQDISVSKEERPESPQKPQTLAKLKLEVIKNHQMMAKAAGKTQLAAATSSQSKLDCAVPAVGANSPKYWLEPFPLEKNDGELFEVIVQCIESTTPKRAWVILASHEAVCDKLLRDIQSQLNRKGEPITYEQIEVNDIFAAPFDGDVYYRVVILEKVDPAKSLVKVRLIDYGDTMTVPTSELLAPILLMKNLRAFAFQIEIANLNRSLELCERIRIKVIRSEKECKFVEMEQTPMSHCLLDMLGIGEEKCGSGGIVSVLSSRKALVMLSAPAVKPFMKVLFTQLVEVAPNFPIAKEPAVSDLVCINSSGAGWSRGLIVDQHENNQLVYTVDNGTIDLVLKDQEIRILPDEYKHKPRLVVLMEIVKVIMNEVEFKRLCYLPSFAFGFERVSYDHKNRSMKALMKDAEGKRSLAEVEFTEFVCDLKKVGINYWPHIPQDKCVVKITSVLNVSSVIICPQDKINIYTDLLQTILPGLKPLTSSPLANDVIIGVDDIMMPYRARVMKNVSSSEVELLDLDNGCIKKIPFGKLYAANGFISNLPVFTIKVQVRDVNEATIRDRDVVVKQLDVFKTEKRSFRLMFEGGSYMYGVKLIDVNTNRSLATLLMEHHDKTLREADEELKKIRDQEEARQKAAEEAEAQKNRDQEEARQKSAAMAQAKIELEQKAARNAAIMAEQKLKAQEEKNSKQEENAKAAIPTKFTINDLKLIPLPAGRNDVKLTILDDGDLNRGIMTVCEMNEANIQRYSTLTEEVNKHASNIGGDGYCPEVDEMCVAVFDADKLWYRAVCIMVAPDKNSFVVQFIDYGNIASVKRESIRSFQKELDFPCVAFTCSVKEFSVVLQKLGNQQLQLGYVIAKEIQADGESFVLTF